MTRRNQQVRANSTARNMRKLADGVSNPLLRIGGDQLNTFSATNYRPQFTSLNRQELEWAYQSSWLCGVAVDTIAEDMTREGITIKHDAPEIVDAMERVISEYGVFEKLNDAIKWSRLYGGAIAVIMIDGQDLSTPLTYIPQGSFRGLYVFDRWQLDISLAEPVQELGEHFGEPIYYNVVNSDLELDIDKKIHYSRVIRLEGRKVPYNIRRAYQGWGASVLEPIYNNIKGFDLATQGSVQLIAKAYLRYYKVKQLRQILTNEQARKGFLNQMDIVRQFQNIEGITVGDTEDEFQTFSYTFTGIPEVLLQLGEQISGGLGVPLVRLFGQSPAGLNSTGESDIRNYYDSVKKLQTMMLGSAVKRLLNTVYQSVTGDKPSNDLTFEFKSLWQVTQTDKAVLATSLVNAIKDSYAEGLISLETALKELKAQSDVTGLFATITDEEISLATEQEKADLMMGDRYEEDKTETI